FSCGKCTQSQILCGLTAVATGMQLVCSGKEFVLSHLSIVHCLSYTAVLLNFLPWASVPLEITVRLLPSTDRIIVPVIVTFLSFFTVKPNLCLLLLSTER